MTVCFSKKNDIIIHGALLEIYKNLLIYSQIESLPTHPSLVITLFYDLEDIHIHTYIYMCVCVSVCVNLWASVYVRVKSLHMCVLQWYKYICVCAYVWVYTINSWCYLVTHKLLLFLSFKVEWLYYPSYIAIKIMCFQDDRNSAFKMTVSCFPSTRFDFNFFLLLSKFNVRKKQILLPQYPLITTKVKTCLGQ